MLYMSKYPAIQEQCFEEIKQVIGLERFPRLEDKPSLPFCEATLEEICRHCPQMALGVPRATMENFNIAGYIVPKVVEIDKLDL